MAFHDRPIHEAHAGADLGGADEADGHGLAMEVAAVGGDGLNGVGDGVAVVERGAEVGLALVGGDDGGLEGHVAADEGDGALAGPRGGEGEEEIGVALEFIEHGRVADEGVLDHLAEAGTQFAGGQRGEGGDVGDDGAGLVEGADEILAGGQVDGDLAADGGVDHAEEGGGGVDEGHAADVRGGGGAGEVGDDAAAEGEDDIAALGAGAAASQS